MSLQDPRMLLPFRPTAHRHSRNWSSSVRSHRLRAYRRLSFVTHLKVLCLPSGDADGLGDARANELREGCIHVREGNTFSPKDSKLQDRFYNWPILDIRDFLLRTFKQGKVTN